MTYIPKNKIQSNLTTPGGEYILSTNKADYIGTYYKLATGQAFTGKYPGNGENILLIKLVNAPTLEETQSGITTSSTTDIPPLYPTPKDYKHGIFIRYFSKKRNEYLFNELTKDQYDILNNTSNRNFELYKPFNIKWMLTGSVTTVSDFNRYSILNAEEKEQVYGLNEFLQMNYTQYYKETV